MDQIGGINVVYYALKDLRIFFEKNPQSLDLKKVREIYVGWMVSQIIHYNNGPLLTVGIPLREVEKHENPRPGPSIEQVLGNIELIDDTDVDLYLSGEKDYKTPFLRLQVTRLVPNSNNVVKHKGIYGLLEKKFRVQTDKSIILVISVEDNLSLEIDELSEFLKNRSIPYGKIFVVGKVNEDNNRFKIIEIYPEMAEYEPVIIN